MKRKLKFGAGALFACALAIGPAWPAGATDSTHGVIDSTIRHGYPSNPSSSDNLWYLEDTRVGGSVVITSDFGGPTGFGSKSLGLATNNQNSAKAQAFTYQDVRGLALGAVTGLSYYTYQSSLTRTTEDGPAFQLRVDTDGNLSTIGDQTNLVYEPYWNDVEGPDPQQPLAPNTWQFWDATAGDWWSSQAINCSGGTPTPFTVPAGAGGGPGTFTTPAAVANGCPGALVAAIGVNVGSFNPSFIVAADGIRLQTATDSYTWDFGPK
jgi:hypothetical protein